MGTDRALPTKVMVDVSTPRQRIVTLESIHLPLLVAGFGAVSTLAVAIAVLMVSFSVVGASPDDRSAMPPMPDCVPHRHNVHGIIKNCLKKKAINPQRRIDLL